MSAEDFAGLKELAKAMKEQRHSEALDLHYNRAGWTRHTPYHWSRQLAGHRMDYWPSTGKWHWNGGRYRGTPYATIEFILKQEGAENEH